MKGLAFFFFILYLLGVSTLSAQEPYATHYGTEHGLPSLESYMVKIDSKGYVWVATDRGISRFDGTKFITYNQKDGLEDLTVFALSEDNNGRMWAATFGGRLFYFENDRFHAFAANDTVIKLVGGHNITSMVIRDDTAWIGVANEPLIRIKVNADYQTTPENFTRFSHDCYFVEFPNGQVVMGKNGYYYSDSYSPENLLNFSLIKASDTLTLKTVASLSREELSTTTMSFKRMENGDLLFAMLKKLFLIQNEKDITILPSQFIPSSVSIFQDSDEDIWIGSINSGVRIFDPINYNLKHHFFQQYSITSIAEDNEGGIWLSTLEAGLLYLPSKDILNLNLSEQFYSNKFTCMTDNTEKLFLATFQGELFEVEMDSNSNWFPTDYHDFKTQINAIEYHNGTFLASTLTGLYSIKNYDFQKIGDTTGYITMSDSFIYVGISETLVYDHDFQFLYSFGRAAPPPRRVRCHAVDKYGNLWQGAVQGLYLYKNDSLQFLGDKDSSLTVRVTQITADEMVYATTLGYGVVVIDPLSMELSHIDEKSGLPSNNCSAVYLDTNDHLWVATEKGLCILQKDVRGKFQVKKIFTAQDGIAGGEIIELISYKNHLWVMTQQSISSIPLKENYLNQTPPNIEVDKVCLLEKDTTIAVNKQQFNYDENNLLFFFESTSYKNAFEKIFKYRLIGLDSNFQQTKNHSVQFASLLPGEYTFEVIALNNDGVGSQIANWSFTIAPPYWESWWFNTLMILVISAIILFIIWYRDKVKSEKIGLELAVIENEQRAVTAQINPHFIYNAMNSVQYHVLEKESKVAADLLAKFSELMRKVLSNTKDSFITLESEISILELYLSLEKERFEKRFEFYLDIEGGLDTEGIKIPSMVVQPQVENAIWHGLLNKESGIGKLHVSLKSEGESLIWRIKDNGVGRIQSEELKKKNDRIHTSSGIKLTVKRLELLSKQSKKPYSMLIRDVIDENTDDSGTEVIITMYKLFS